MTSLPLAYFQHHISPFLIEFGHGWGIRWYGLAYVTGFALLYLGLVYQARRGWSQLQGEAIGDYVMWVSFCGVILGGRLGYCLMYDFSRTMADPLSIVRLTDGGISGMSAHGGMMGVMLVMYFFSRSRRIPFFNLADATTLVTPIALFFGRIANFVNGELWGRQTTVPWAVLFPAPGARIDGEMVPRHPSQLYEAGLEGLALFIILYLVRTKTKRDGAVALTFMGGYAIMRTICEFFREPDEQIRYYWGWVTQGQILSVLLLLGAIGLAWFHFGRERGQPSAVAPVESGGKRGKAE